MPKKGFKPKQEIKFVSHGVQQPQQQAQILPPINPVESNENMEMDNDNSNPDETKVERPSWMKKLQGVKKISNKERRRRQNQNLRRLLTPKSALMVLNEIIPGEHFEFKIQEVPQGQYYKQCTQTFSAELNINGQTYTGLGETKAAARHAVAEQAIRDLIISKMAKVQEKQPEKEANGDEKMETNEEEPMPMLQLASFALHKLFSEWEGKGVRVPQLKPSSSSASQVSEPDTEAPPPPPKPKKVKTLPENASTMHPCMLLTYMRPQQEYRELARLGDRPPDLLYKIGVTVDGVTFVGQGGNKKEARRQAAIAACKELFNVTFIPEA